MFNNITKSMATLSIYIRYYIGNACILDVQKVLKLSMFKATIISFWKLWPSKIFKILMCHNNFLSVPM